MRERIEQGAVVDANADPARLVCRRALHA